MFIGNYDLQMPSLKSGSALGMTFIFQTQGRRLERALYKSEYKTYAVDLKSLGGEIFSSNSGDDRGNKFIVANFIGEKEATMVFLHELPKELIKNESVYKRFRTALQEPVHTIDGLLELVWL